jgi:hypothetical protein
MGNLKFKTALVAVLAAKLQFGMITSEGKVTRVSSDVGHVYVTFDTHKQRTYLRNQIIDVKDA